MVRSAAIQAVRLMPGPAVEALLGKAAASDEDPSVRRAALRSLQGRPVNAALLAVGRGRLEGDEDATVRLAAAELLASWASDEPRARRYVEQAAASDPSSTVRDESKAMLARLAPKG